MFDKERGVPSMSIVGKSAKIIAELAGFEVAPGTKMLMVPLTTTGGEDWMSREKLSPVLGWFIVDSKDAAINAAAVQLEFGGAGHSAVVFTENEAIAHEYAMKVHANRVVWNQPSVHGTIGALYNSLVPRLPSDAALAAATSPARTLATRTCSTSSVWPAGTWPKKYSVAPIRALISARPAMLLPCSGFEPWLVTKEAMFRERSIASYL